MGKNHMTIHASDCALHNAPALPAEPCNCDVSNGAFVRIVSQGELVALRIGSVKVRTWSRGKVAIAEKMAARLRRSIGADRAKHKRKSRS